MQNLQETTTYLKARHFNKFERLARMKNVGTGKRSPPGEDEVW